MSEFSMLQCSKPNAHWLDVSYINNKYYRDLWLLLLLIDIVEHYECFRGKRNSGRYMGAKYVQSEEVRVRENETLLPTKLSWTWWVKRLSEEIVVDHRSETLNL